MDEFSHSDLWGLDAYHVQQKEKKRPKPSVLDLIKHELQKENPTDTDIWAIVTVKFNTVYKVLNYLPNTLISHLLFPTVHEAPFTPVKCIYFPTVSLWVMGPIRRENSEEMQHNLEHKDNKSYELLLEFFISLNPDFFWNSQVLDDPDPAYYNHLITRPL